LQQALAAQQLPRLKQAEEEGPLQTCYQAY